MIKDHFSEDNYIIDFIIHKINDIIKINRLQKGRDQFLDEIYG